MRLGSHRYGIPTWTGSEINTKSLSALARVTQHPGQLRTRSKDLPTSSQGPGFLQRPGRHMPQGRVSRVGHPDLTSPLLPGSPAPGAAGKEAHEKEISAKHANLACQGSKSLSPRGEKRKKGPRVLWTVCLSGPLRAAATGPFCHPPRHCSEQPKPSHPGNCGDSSYSAFLALPGPFLPLIDLSFIAGPSQSSVSLMAWSGDHRERVSFQPHGRPPLEPHPSRRVSPSPGSGQGTGTPTQCAV